MSDAPLAKIEAQTAAEVCANFELKKEAKQLLRDGMKPRDFVTALIENKKNLDAIEFMAHALPTREGVWWGCLCMQHALGDELSPNDRSASTAAVQWVLQPSQENSSAARAPGQTAGPASAAGAVATAASQTGVAAAKSIATAVKLASIKKDPAALPKTQRAYVELGIAIAEGKFL